MNIEKKFKKEANKKIDSMINNANIKEKKFPLYAKILIPFGSLALIGAITLGITIPLNKSNIKFNALIETNKANKITNKKNNIFSLSTFNSYKAFSEKFTLLMLDSYLKENKEDSLGISLPDAYICLALLGAISTPEAQKDILDYLELDNINELNIATKEITTTFGTLYEDDNKVSGGYNLNSIWLDPLQVELVKENNEELFNDLKTYYDASIFLEALTINRAYDYLKKYGLEGMPIPKINLPNDPYALSVMSVYYCLDYFEKEDRDWYYKQFLSQTHKMDYFLNEEKLKVDYIEDTSNNVVYEGKNFYGSNLSINNLTMGFYLPHDKNALPSSIIEDVVKKNYNLIETTFIDHDGQIYDTNVHEVTIKAPYFSLDNDIILDEDTLKTIFPNITLKGAGELIAKSFYESLYLSSFMQFSTMKFNYEGFYSCSTTVALEAGTSAGMEFTKFLLELNHPYVFNVKECVRVNDEVYELPLIIGEIVAPTYKD